MIDERQKVVDETISWLKTPHHHQGRVKGAYDVKPPLKPGGVDCLMLFGMVFYNAGLIEQLPAIEYSSDGHLHKGEELVIGWMEKYAYRIEREQILPADLVVYKYGRRYSHGAVIIDSNGRMIHAVLGRCVEYGHIDKVGSGGHKPTGTLFYRYNGWRT